METGIKIPSEKIGFLIGPAGKNIKAMQEQYLPKFAGDALPETTTGAIIALADRLDTITGIFGIGQQPTGSKDPFALRRASLGVLRLLVDKQLDLDLVDELVSGVDAVVHFAAKVGVGQSMYRVADYTETNNLCTAILMEELIERMRCLPGRPFETTGR